MSGRTDVESWRAWIGREGALIYGAYEISKATIGYFCEASENANPLYRDEEFARSTALGGIICPPTMLFTMAMPPKWTATGEPTHQPLLAMEVPLDCDAAINGAIEEEFCQPLRPGDRIHFQSCISEISPKTTRLGQGFYITEEVTYWNQRDERVAVVRNTILRYKKSVSGA